MYRMAIKMLIDIPLNRKQSKADPEHCNIVDTIELPYHEFESFRNNLLSDYSFISEHADEMGTDQSGVSQCLLVLCEDKSDGILVESSGYNYARYSAYVPNARTLIQLDQHPSLNDFIDEMCSLTDKYTRKAVDGQIDCKYRINFDEVRSLCVPSKFNQDLFMHMLSDRDEINGVEYSDDGCTVTVAEPYLRQEDEQSLRILDSEDIEIMCAKHVLWLHDAGGEQADFSKCLLKDLDLSGKNLINAVFDGAKFINTNLRKASLCFSLFNETKFQNCNCIDIVAEESEFKNAECVACNFDGGIFTHSDFTGAKFYDCTIKNGSLQNCCLERINIGDMELGDVYMRGCSYNEQEWSDESPRQNISM